MGSDYGSANAAEHWIENQPKPTAYELQKQAEANARMNAHPDKYQSQLPRSGSGGVNRGGGASNRQNAADAMARQQKAAQAKSAAQAALRAIPPKGPVQYQSKNPVYYDAVDFLAKKYGVNPQLMTNPEVGRNYRERYGLTPVPGNVMKDAKGNIIKGAPIQPGPGFQGASYGSDGVFLGYYDTKGRVTATSLKDASINAIEHQQDTPESHTLIVPADAAKGVIYGWSPQRIAQFQKDHHMKVTGLPKDIKSKWAEGVNGAQQYYQFSGQPVTPEGYLDATYGTKKKATGSGGSGGRGRGGSGGGGGGGGSGVGATTSRTTLTSRSDLQRALNQMFQDKLGRNATDKELSGYLSQVNSQERLHPQTATVDASGNSTVAGGVDPMTVAENYMSSVQGGEVGTRAAGVDYFAAAMKMLGGGGL